mgnify:CR=1 FL=1
MRVDKTIYDGRPQEAAVTDVENAAYDLLEQAGVPFARAQHDEAATIEDCQAVEELLGITICKNLLLNVANKSAYYLLVLPGKKRFKTKELSAMLGCSRLSFSGAADMMRLLGVEPGSVSVLALANDKDRQVTLVIDRDVLEDEYFGCHPCKNTASLRIRTADLVEKILLVMEREPVVVELP